MTEPTTIESATITICTATLGKFRRVSPPFQTASSLFVEPRSIATILGDGGCSGTRKPQRTLVLISRNQQPLQSAYSRCARRGKGILGDVERSGIDAGRMGRRVEFAGLGCVVANPVARFP